MAVEKVYTTIARDGWAVISTRTHGPSDLVLPGETGWLLPLGDVQALNAALRDAVQKPAKTARSGAESAERVRNH